MIPKNVILKLLILEDSLQDKELITEQLTEAGFQLDVTHTEVESTFTEALKNSRYDVIISDYSLPGFDAFGALVLCQKICPEIPFICVSGSIGEEKAIELLKMGAVDYVLKDRPERLPHAIHRALDEVKEKAALVKAERELLESEARFRQVAETAQEWIWEVDNEGLYTYSSPMVETLLGYTPDELVGKKHFYDFFLPKEKEKLKTIAFEVFSKKEVFRNYENANLQKNGQKVILSTSGSPIFDDNGNLRGYSGADEDITERRKSEEALRESEAKFRDLFYNHAAVKLIIDPENGNIVEANKSAASFYGWPVETLQTMNISQINALQPEDVNREMKRARALKKIRFEFRHRKSDGKLVDVEVFSSSIKIGDMEFLHSIIHDISEKKKAEEQLKLLNRAVEASPVAVNITDTEGNMIYTNPGFTKISGYSSEEVLGKNPRLLKSGLQPKSFYKELWDTILSGNDWIGEFQNKKKNGELYWVNAFISPIINNIGAITHFVAIKEDITQRKKMVEELVEAKEKAEESDQLKSAFLANMSHEIRTPMNGILGFTDLLLNPDLDSEEKESYIKIVHQSGQRMLNTVTDIVEISKIEAGLINLSNKEIDLNERLKELTLFFQLEAEEKGLKLILKKLLTVENEKVITDQNKFDSILTNLIKNAIKYTDTGSIHVGCIHKGNEILFFVKDTGIGIPANRQEAVFNRFEQADIADTRAYEGSGLGLSIAKSYVEMLGGKIWLESEEGKGSVFYFTLPVKSSLAEKPNTEKEISFQSEKLKSKVTGLKILTAEDNETSRNYISLIINDFSSELLEAKTGNEVIELCRQNKDIDLILMDIKMPELDGYGATRRIREFNKEVIIIAQTAYGFSGNREKALESGCNDYISKPIDKAKLQTLIQKYFGK